MANADLKIVVSVEEKQPGFVVLEIEDTILKVPAKTVARAIFEKVFQDKPAAPQRMTNAAVLPAIGEAFEGGIYAGLTIHDNVPHALILLPGDFKGDWKTSLDWAEKEDGELPSRFDALVLFKNLKREFKEEYYWTDEQHASDESSAWLQYFGNGYQSYNLKGNVYRARAVRRVAI